MITKKCVKGNQMTILTTNYDYYCCLETCSCCPVRYFGTLFWDDIANFWDENSLLFTFLTGKLWKNLFWTNRKFIYLLSEQILSKILSRQHEKVCYVLPIRQEFWSQNRLKITNFYWIKSDIAFWAAMCLTICILRHNFLYM